MAGSVLSSTAVLRLNIRAKLNICASISATSPSDKTLQASVKNRKPTMKQIILIACVSLKGDKKTKAKDLYKSSLFKSSLAYAYKQNPDNIYILSALHHLLDLDKEIEPYDVTLSNVPKDKRKAGLKILSTSEKKEWGKKVIEQLSAKTDLKKDNFIILAGQEYIKPIIADISHFTNPLKGLRQGERVKFLNDNNTL